MIRIVLLAAFSSLVSACSMLGMKSSDGESAAGGATASSPDAMIVRDIAEANLAEIATGKLAVSKAASSEVRQFGQHMIDEHSKLQTQGSQVASAKQLPTPKAPDARHQAAAKKLESLSGQGFDRAYMEQMVKDHSETLKKLESAVSTAKDPEVRALAQQSIPHVRQHLEMAQRLAAQVVGGSK